MELFQVARKKTMTERTCRGAFRKTGIYPFNPKALLDEVTLKEIEKGRLMPAENSSSSPATTPTRNPAAQRQLVNTPHNTAAVQSHVAAVLDELDSLAVQGIPISTPTRNRVLQLGKSARMTMAQEAIQLETNRHFDRTTAAKEKAQGLVHGQYSQTRRLEYLLPK